MTWDELRLIYDWLPETSVGWHQHVNGGGWVQDNALVCDSERVCDNALVCGCAQVYGNARVYGCALVCGNARVYGNAQVCGFALVYDNARVHGYAQVYDNARVCGFARVCDFARVCGTHNVTPIYIQGTRYWMGYSGCGLVTSGCITMPLSWWRENVERCAEEHGYTPVQQKEYRSHVENIAAWVKLFG